MKYIFYVLCLLNIVFGNDELNGYLNNKDLEYLIIKDEKNQRVIIDLLYDENRMIIFSKDKSGDYQKTFDEKLYFCQNIKYSNVMIKELNNELFISCSMPNVDGKLYREFYNFEDYSSLNSKLLTIEKQYINIDNDSIEKDYIFTPKEDISTLKNYTDKEFSEKYLNDNYYNFRKINYLINLTQLLENSKSNQKVSIENINEVLKNEPLNTKTLQKYNDIAYYLQQAKSNDEAIFLLEIIIEKFPNRTVAYLNLADAYEGINDKEKAKINYEKYIDLMKKSGKETKIPKRVLEYK
jgi:hypothetical protein